MSSQPPPALPDHGAQKSPDISVVVPTYRECRNLPPLLDQIYDALSGMRETYEVLIVDEGSDDGTRSTVRNLAEEGHPVRFLLHSAPPDLSRSVVQGFREARGRILVCMDADLSHPPHALPRLIRSIKNDADFVLASRYLDGSEARGLDPARLLLSKLATLCARPFTQVSDPMSGFFALKRSVFRNSAPLQPYGYKLALELLVKTRCSRIEEVPISFRTRRHGSSKLDLEVSWKLLIHLVRLAVYRLRNIFPG